jgi:hypothetical protein
VPVRRRESGHSSRSTTSPGSRRRCPRAEDLAAAEARVYADELADKWTLWRSVVDRLEVDVRVEIEARATIEQKFFGGHEVLLADAAA